MTITSPEDIKVGRIYTISYKGRRNYKRDPIPIFITSVEDRGPNEHTYVWHYHLTDPNRPFVTNMHILFQNYIVEEIG